VVDDSHDGGRAGFLLEDLQGLHDQLEAAGFEEREVAAAAAAPEPAADFAESAAGGAGLLVAVRQNLDALALFEPDAVTDAEGALAGVVSQTDPVRLAAR